VSPGHSLSTLNGKFLIKSCVLNALKIVIVNFLKKIVTKFEMLKECPGTLVNKTHKIKSFFSFLTCVIKTQVRTHVKH